MRDASRLALTRRLRGLLPWLGVAGLLALGRFPFLNNGYGLDPDAWRVADAASRIAEQGRYFPSRPPGAPLQEIASSLFIDAGPKRFAA